MNLQDHPKPHRGAAFGLQVAEGACPDCSAHSVTRPYGRISVTEIHHDDTCPNPNKFDAAIDLRNTHNR